VTDIPNPGEPTAFDPASMSTTSLAPFKTIWYKRPWVLVTFAIVVVVAISVITDLPHPITKAQDAASQNANITQINKDIAPCVFALQESFSFYTKDVNGSLSASNKAQVPSLLTNDQTACSLASGSLYDMTQNIQILDTSAGKHIDKMMSVVLIWCTGDALKAIEDIQYLFSHPGDAAKIRDLGVQQAMLANDRQLALNDVVAANAILGINLTPPQLPAIAHLVGT